MQIKKRVLFFTLFACLALSPLSRGEEVWIDVRTPAEHAVDNIDGDLLISHEKIVDEVSRLYPDKSTDIRLYCRSGGRAGIATSALEEAGYSSVSNAGGIEDARQQRGLSE